MRVLMLEPNGEGGICHYTYCLAEELQAQGHQMLVATASPYELAAAPRAFSIEPIFGPGRERQLIQQVLRASRRGTSAASQSAASPASPASPAPAEQLPSGGIAGRLSHRLAAREYRQGWQRTLGLAARKGMQVAHLQWLREPERDMRWLAALRRLGLPTVITVHNVLPHDTSSAVRETWGRLYGMADALIVHYQGAWDDLRALGVAAERVTVIPHGTYLPIRALMSQQADDSTESAWAQARAREALGIPPDAPVALFFGLMRPYKGIEYLLDALAHLRTTLPDVRLVLAGRAPAGFGPFAQRIRALGLEDAVIAAPRYIHLTEVARFFEACDVVTLPYVEASQSGVVQLAYAFGRPVVATSVGGLPEAVFDGQTGQLVPPRDSMALAAALNALLRDRARAAALGAQARDISANTFGWAHIAAATTNVYERALQLAAR